MLALILSATPAAAQVMIPVRDLADYAQSAAALSFVAAGVGSLEDCRSRVRYWERETDTTRVLEARCDGSDEEQVARMTFVVVRAGLPFPRLVPFRLELEP